MIGQPSNDHPSWLRVAGLLALGTFLLILLAGRSLDLLGSPSRMGLVLAWGAVAAAFWLTGRISIVVAYLVIGGLLLRWVELPVGGQGPSDVLAAVNEALEVWFAGGNPYDHAYQDTRPPGQPMPYPPGALLFHLPGHLLAGLAGMQLTQFLSAAVCMGGLAWFGARLSWLAALPALAVYAAVPNLVLLATDGSNDTGTGALLLLALIGAVWAIERGADGASLAVVGIAAALAISTKQIALPVALAVAVYVVRLVGWTRASRCLAAAGIVLLLVSLPFLVLGPAEYVGGLLSFLGVHDDIYGWNIWAFAQGIGIRPWERDAATVLNVACSAVALVGLLLIPLRTLAGAALAGVLATLVVLFTARWTTYAYFAMLAPVLLALPALAIWDAGRQAEASPA